MEYIRMQRPDVVVVDFYGAWTQVAFACLEATVQENLAPVLVVSAYADEYHVQLAADGGAVGYLVKPWTDFEIITMVRMADDHRRMRRRLVETALEIPAEHRVNYYTLPWLHEMLRQRLVSVRG